MGVNMIIFFNIVLIAIFIFSYRNDRFSPGTLFLGLWSVVLSLYNFHLYDIFDVTNRTYGVIIFGIVAYEVGYLFNDKFIASKSNREKVNNSMQFTVQNKNEKNALLINTTTLNIISLITIICSLPTGIIRTRYLIQCGFDVSAVKNALILGKLPSGTILDTFIVAPLTQLLLVASTYFLINQRKNKLIIFSGIYLTLYRYFTTGGRLAILNYIIALLISMRISGKTFGDIPSKIKKWTVRIVSALSVLIIILMTRNTENGFKNIYFYLCGCIPMLDHVVTKQSGYFDLGSTNGTLSFYGLINPFCQVLSKFGLDDLSHLCDKSELYLMNIERPNYASPSRLYNAFVTFAATFYIDFGMIGVVFLSFLFGFFSSHLYKKYKERCSLYTALPVGIVYGLIITSIIKFGFCGYGYGLGIIYILVLRKYMFLFDSEES